jgi:Fic family protein
MSWLSHIVKKTQDMPIANVLGGLGNRKPQKYTDAERDELLVKIEILTARNDKLQDVANITATQQVNGLAEEEVSILKVLASEDEASAHQIARAFEFSLARAQYHLTRLAELQYVVSITAMERRAYLLDQRGREYLAANQQA